MPPRLRVALVGLGRWGQNYLGGLAATPTAELAIVCDRDADRFGPIANDVRRTSSFDEVLGSDVEALILATPSATHASLAARGLLSGKHVLVEKPMATSRSDLRELERAVRLSGRVLLVGHQILHSAGFRSLHQATRAGLVGEIRSVVATRTSCGAKHNAASALWELGPHDVSACIRLLGAAPLEISACLVGGSSQEVAVTLHFHHAVANIHLSRLGPCPGRSLEVVGTLGRACFDELSGQVVGVPQALEAADPLVLQCRHFVECALGRAASAFDFAEGRIVSEVLIEAERLATISRDVATTSLSVGG